MTGWAQRVYECDKRVAEIGSRMQSTGFAFDTARARELSDALFQLEAKARQDADDAAGFPIRRTDSGGFGLHGDDGLEGAFFGTLRAPVFFRSALTGRPSLGIDSLRGYQACADPLLRALADAVIRWRSARKLRVTYIDRVMAGLGVDSRIHPTWLNYGAVSGRWACQGPNLMNLPTPRKDPTCSIVPGGIRSLYCAPDGRLLVTFDAKQLEMRMAAVASGDEAMIAACASEDLHSTNAALVFGELWAELVRAVLGHPDDPPCKCDHCRRKKGLRTIAKSSGFAVCYLAEADTVYTRIVAEGVPITLRQVEQLLRRLRMGFKTYYAWQAQRLNDAKRELYTDTPILGRRRWFHDDPKPPECANFPIQGGAADLMNLRLPEILHAIESRKLDAFPVAQVHDSVVFECAAHHAERVGATCREVFEQPITITSSGRPIEATFPIDVEISSRWS